MARNYTFLRAILWIVCLYHVLLGILLSLPGDWLIDVAEGILGVTKAPTEQALFVGRILGVYMGVFGIGMGVAAWNPIKNRALLSVGAILVVVRSVQRVLQADYLEDAFGVATGRNWTMVVVLLAFAAAIALFRWRVYVDMRSSEVADSAARL